MSPSQRMLGGGHCIFLLIEKELIWKLLLQQSLL